MTHHMITTMAVIRLSAGALDSTIPGDRPEPGIAPGWCTDTPRAAPWVDCRVSPTPDYGPVPMTNASFLTADTQLQANHFQNKL